MHNKNTTDPLISRLRRVAEHSPDLASAARLYGAVLPLLRGADLDAAPIPLTRDQMEDKLHRGIPLLQDVDLDIDVEAARALMIKLADAVACTKGTRSGFLQSLLRTWHPGEDHEAALRIKKALEERVLDAGHLVALVAAGEHAAVSAAATEHGFDPELVLALAQFTLKPALHAWSSHLPPLPVAWHKSACFVCGAPAMLAELQGNDQVRHMRCGACGSDWQSRRLQCAQCGNEDHRTQHYVYGERGRDTMRVEVCDVCKGYIKVIASFSPEPSEMLPIVDLETRHLDRIAQQHGYIRPAAAIPAEGPPMAAVTDRAGDISLD